MSTNPQDPTPNSNDEIRFLFRFRDLSHDTLKEHRNLIKSHQSVWWGWWKRPTEYVRMDVWEKLQEQIVTQKKVRIGLFHSGTGQVFSADVTEVTLPENENATELLEPPKDKNLVPAYYRNSPYIRAWMRLVHIDEKPITFFNEYSFDGPPNLSNYKQEVLERLDGKIIKTSDELRGMDTTIWSIRKKRITDPDREIVLTTGRLPAAISSTVVNIESDVILHITDPHYAVGKFREQHVWRLERENGNAPTLAVAIKNALGSVKPGLILITGDLTFTGAVDEFQEAVQGLNSLAEKFHLDPDRFVIIPGNHDIVWTKETKYKDDAKVTEAPETATKNYKAFYRQFFTHDADSKLAMGRRFLTPCGLTLEICGLNSSSLETGKKFLAGMGRIEQAAFEEVTNKLNWKENPSLALRILMTHHHLALTEDLELTGEYYSGFGIAIDAARILRMAANRGVQLVLHGHKHRAFLWRSGVYDLPERSRKAGSNISLLGGGSAGSSETESHANYFNLIDVNSAGLDLTVYRSANAGAFDKMGQWTAPIELQGDPRRLVLLDWKPQ